METCATGCTKCTYKTEEEALPLFQGRKRYAKDREDKRKAQAKSRDHRAPPDGLEVHWGWWRKQGGAGISILAQKRMRGL